MSKDYLYRIEYEGNIDDMFNNIDYFPKDKKRLYIGMFIIYMIIMIPFSIIVSLILSLLFKLSFIFLLVFYILVCIVTLLIRLDKNIYITYKKNFNKRKNKNSITEFYNNYLIRYSDDKPYTVNYKDINNMIETTDGFYFTFSRVFYSINKKYCDKKLIDFIRSKVNNIESVLGDNIKFKKRECKHPKFLKVFMFLLFILSICTIGFSIMSSIILSLIQDTVNCNAWCYLIFIPIPLLSFILGFYFKYNKYSNLEIDYNLNIIIGGIFTIILILFGYNYIIPSNIEDSLNKQYKSIIKVNLPSYVLRGNAMSGAYNYKDNIVMYDIDIMDFTKKDGDKLYKEISNSNNWILNPKLDSKYINSRLYKLKLNKNTYVLEYYDSLYNTYSLDEGEHYIFTYDYIKRHLEIHKYEIKN